MYRPIENLWLPVAPMAAGRDVAGGVLLSNGSAIVIGGSSGGTRLASTEVFSPSLKAWSPGPPLAAARAYFALVKLADGRVLVIGGDDDQGNPLRSSELFSAGPG
jgi:N-acetylneuraminic acid mutarotase